MTPLLLYAALAVAYGLFAFALGILIGRMNARERIVREIDQPTIMGLR